MGLLLPTSLNPQTWPADFAILGQMAPNYLLIGGVIGAIVMLILPARWQAWPSMLLLLGASGLSLLGAIWRLWPADILTEDSVPALDPVSGATSALTPAGPDGLPLLLLTIGAGLAAFAMIAPSLDRPSAQPGLHRACVFAVVAACAGVAGAGSDLILSLAWLLVLALAGVCGLASGVPFSIARAFDALVGAVVSAGLCLVGLGFLIFGGGDLSATAIAPVLSGESAPPLMRLGLGVTLAGLLSLSLTIGPGAWFRVLISAGTAPIGVLMIVVGSQLSLYVAGHLLALGFGGHVPFVEDVFRWLIAPAAIFGCFWGGVIALRAQDTNRLVTALAGAQACFALLGLSLVSADGLSAMFLLLLVNGFALGLLFLALRAVGARIGTSILSLSGLGRDAPLLAGLICFSALSTVGVPLTPGFAGRWSLIAGLMGEGHEWLAAGALAASLAALFSILLLVERLYVHVCIAPPRRLDGPWVLVVPLVLAAFALVACGFLAGGLADTLAHAAQIIWAGGLMP